MDQVSDQECLQYLDLEQIVLIHLKRGSGFRLRSHVSKRKQTVISLNPLETWIRFQMRLQKIEDAKAQMGLNPLETWIRFQMS